MAEMHTEYSLVKTIWRDIDRHVDAAVHGIAEGRGKIHRDPFSGLEKETLLPQSVLEFRANIEEDELFNDAQFLESLRGLLRETMMNAAFSILCAVDGSAGFVDNASVTLTDGDGHELNHCFHEIFHQLDPERQDN